MSVKLSDLWDKLRTSYWFVPLLMTIGAALLAAVARSVDTLVPPDALGRVSILYQSDAEQARTLLLAIAGGTLGLVGAVLSITMVPLTIAAAQLGPRLLRTFLRDTPTQTTIGVFCGTFVYCTLLALSIPLTSEGAAVPRIAVTLGLLSPLVTIVMLIIFVHHISVLIQAPTVIAEVGAEIEALIVAEFPLRGQTNAPNEQGGEAAREQVERKGLAVVAAHQGYVHAIDRASLVRAAMERDLVFLLKRLPGDFVARNDTLLLAAPVERASAALNAPVNEAYAFGTYRTLIQDIEFGINSLVEIALRALSPAINDPLTAIACLDRLGAALGVAVGRERPSPFVYDAAGSLRLIADPLTFGRMLDAAFHPIRQYGRGNAEVLIRMLRSIAEIGVRSVGAEERAALLHHATLIELDSRTGLPNPFDQQRVRAAFEQTARALERADNPTDEPDTDERWPTSAQPR